jgi:hypothetical protein
LAVAQLRGEAGSPSLRDGLCSSMAASKAKPIRAKLAQCGCDKAIDQQKRLKFGNATIWQDFLDKSFPAITAA